MKEQLAHFAHFIPFVGLALSSDTNHQPVVTRLIEAGIIGAVVMYGTVQVLGERINNLESRVQELSIDVKTIRRDIYRPYIGEPSQ
jgi:hypothetical protein